jgi:hypothetical protein
MREDLVRFARRHYLAAWMRISSICSRHGSIAFSGAAAHRETPGNILEKIIRYEAVHAIDGWMICAAGRSCRTAVAMLSYPQLGDELIFVEVALTWTFPCDCAAARSGPRSDCGISCSTACSIRSQRKGWLVSGNFRSSRWWDPARVAGSGNRTCRRPHWLQRG